MKKNMIGVIVAIVVSFVTTGSCIAEEVNVSGVVRTDYYSDADKASISQVRFNLYAPMATDTYYFVRVEPNRYNLDGEDWLKLFFIQYKNITGGRLPSNEGYALPTPDKLFTAMWPRISGGFYTNGIQITEMLSAGYTVTFEVSGSPNGTAVRDNLGYSQVSMRLTKGTTNIILRYDDDRNSQILVSGEKSFAKMLAREAFYWRSDGGTVKSGGYVFLEKKVSPSFCLHAQTDFAKDAETINTVGIRIVRGKKFVILDREFSAGRQRTLASVVVTF